MAKLVAACVAIALVYEAEAVAGRRANPPFLQGPVETTHRRATATVAVKPAPSPPLLLNRLPGPVHLHGGVCLLPLHMRGRGLLL